MLAITGRQLRIYRRIAMSYCVYVVNAIIEEPAGAAKVEATENTPMENDTALQSEDVLENGEIEYEDTKL